MSASRTNPTAMDNMTQPPSSENSDLAKWRQEELSFIRLYMEICGANEAQARIVFMFHCREIDELNPHQSDESPYVVSPT